MPTLVLQVAPVDVHGGHVKDPPFLPPPLRLLGGFSLSLACLFLRFMPSLYLFFFYMLTHESSLPLALLF